MADEKTLVKWPGERIQQDDNHKLVSNTQITNWDSKLNAVDPVVINSLTLQNTDYSFGLKANVSSNSVGVAYFDSTGKYYGGVKFTNSDIKIYHDVDINNGDFKLTVPTLKSTRKIVPNLISIESSTSCLSGLSYGLKMYEEEEVYTGSTGKIPAIFSMDNYILKLRYGTDPDTIEEARTIQIDSSLVSLNAYTVASTPVLMSSIDITDSAIEFKTKGNYISIIESNESKPSSVELNNGKITLTTNKGNGIDFETINDSNTYTLGFYNGPAYAYAATSVIKLNDINYLYFSDSKGGNKTLQRYIASDHTMVVPELYFASVPYAIDSTMFKITMASTKINLISSSYKADDIIVYSYDKENKVHSVNGLTYIDHTSIDNNGSLVLRLSNNADYMYFETGVEVGNTWKLGLQLKGLGVKNIIYSKQTPEDVNLGTGDSYIDSQGLFLDFNDFAYIRFANVKAQTLKLSQGLGSVLNLKFKNSVIKSYNGSGIKNVDIDITPESIGAIDSDSKNVTDWDTIITPGYYYSDSSSTTVNNAPCTYCCGNVSKSPRSIVQTVYDEDQDGLVSYTRIGKIQSDKSVVWGEWKSVGFVIPSSSN